MIYNEKVVALDKLLSVFEASEGSINMYYGKIGNGKTYSATSDILDYLAQGKVVYANWKIKVEDFDDRKSFFHILKNIILNRSSFFLIPCNKNLYYFDIDEGVIDYTGKVIKSFNGEMSEFISWASALTDCHIFFDEGQDLFDSYEGTKFSKSKRRLILHTRHYKRSLNIISQRFNAIQVSARGNVSRFFKCVKYLDWGFVKMFARYEFQEMKGEEPNEDAEPDSVKKYWGSKRVYNAYNTSYLADGTLPSQTVHYEAFLFDFKGKMQLLKEYIDSIVKPIKLWSIESFRSLKARKDVFLRQIR